MFSNYNNFNIKTMNILLVHKDVCYNNKNVIYDCASVGF